MKFFLVLTFLILIRRAVNHDQDNDDNLIPAAAASPERVRGEGKSKTFDMNCQCGIAKKGAAFHNDSWSFLKQPIKRSAFDSVYRRLQFQKKGNGLL